MGTVVSVYEAKTHLSRLLAEIEVGGEVVITRSGRPVARLVPLGPDLPDRRPGALSGKIVIADDFDEFTDADAAAWYGTGV